MILDQKNCLNILVRKEFGQKNLVQKKGTVSGFVGITSLPTLESTINEKHCPGAF